jgi:hypothetical protein
MGTPWSDMGLSEEETAVMMDDGYDAGNPWWFFESEMAILETGQLFVTKAGRFGYTKRGVRPSDVIIVFNSAPVPHVLRRARQEDESLEKWRFVGDAYVHDLMHFEADEINVKVEDIVIIWCGMSPGDLRR